MAAVLGGRECFPTARRLCSYAAPQFHFFFKSQPSMLATPSQHASLSTQLVLSTSSCLFVSFPNKTSAMTAVCSVRAF